MGVYKVSMFSNMQKKKNPRYLTVFHFLLSCFGNYVDSQHQDTHTLSLLPLSLSHTRAHTHHHHHHYHLNQSTWLSPSQPAFWMPFLKDPGLRLVNGVGESNTRPTQDNRW